MRPYRIPEITKPERQIKELIDAGLIVKSSSPVASPLVCVTKKDGGVRLACDYSYVNSFTVADVFPLCSVDEMVRKVGQNRYISLFDAKSGYWQFVVAPECRWLTAFVTHEGLYEWVRMPFGLRTQAPRLCGLLRVYCNHYKHLLVHTWMTWRWGRMSG